MRFGLFASPQADGAQPGAGPGQGFFDFVDLCVEAEALGYCAVFMVEHHFSGWNQVSQPLALLTFLAARTRTLRLGSAVMVLPWHNPVLLAEQVATLDVISGGRVDLGVGKGYRHSEFRGFNVDQADADARFTEALAVLLRAWTTRDRFSHHGRCWDFDEIVVEPPPLQSPHPPIWIAAASEASIRRAAGQGHGLLLDQYAPVEQIAERIGWFGSGPIAVARQVYVAHGRAEAEAALARQAAFTRRTVDVSRSPSSAGGSHVLGYADTERHALFGTPDEIADGLAALSRAGADYVLVQLAGGIGQVRRFARDVLALVRGA